jgi:hypothetical protein
MNKHTPTVGDIYLDDTGYTIIIFRIDTDGEHYVMFDDGSFDSLYDITDEYTYIGHYDVKQLFEAMRDAEKKYMDIDKQVLSAVQYMNKHVFDRDKNARLVGCDMRVDKDIDTVFIQVYSQIGAGYQWVSVADIMNEYTLKQ